MYTYAHFSSPNPKHQTTFENLKISTTNHALEPAYLGKNVVGFRKKISHRFDLFKATYSSQKFI
jgi:hypothetical protein